jgi:hypothetical protein
VGVTIIGSGGWAVQLGLDGKGNVILDFILARDPRAS